MNNILWIHSSPTYFNIYPTTAPYALTSLIESLRSAKRHDENSIYPRRDIASTNHYKIQDMIAPYLHKGERKTRILNSVVNKHYHIDGKRGKSPGTTCQSKMEVPVPIHTPLKDGEVRLVTLAQGKFDDDIECSLSTHLLERDPTYEALSWYWGTPNPGTDPTISLCGQTFSVPVNLERALRYLRAEDKSLPKRLSGGSKS